MLYNQGSVANQKRLRNTGLCKNIIYLITSKKSTLSSYMVFIENVVVVKIEKCYVEPSFQITNKTEKDIFIDKKEVKLRKCSIVSPPLVSLLN